MIKKVNKKGYKKRPKNKQEIDSFSGVIKKRKKIQPEAKTKIEFQFTDLQGHVYTQDDGRLKIQDGGVSFLIKLGDKWVILKGKLNWIKKK